MRQNDRRRRLFKTFTACLLAIAMLLSNVMGAVEVQAAAVKEPTINNVFYGDTTISGANLAKDRVNKKLVIATVHVILKGEGGNVKAELSVTPKSGTSWKVDLPEGVKVAKGDKVTVYQQIGEDKSPEVTKDAQASKASTVTLTMPTGELLVEEYTANVLNDDEKAEAIDLLKKVNPTVANDIKSVEFKVTGIDPNKVASYTVTYTDNSKTEEIQAPGLTIKPVTETSRSPEIGSITVVDNVVKGKLAGEGSFDGIKVQLILNVKKEKSGDFCTDKGCKIDKDSSNAVDVALNKDGTFSYTLKEEESLTLDQIVGVSVKEPHKFVSCSTTTVKPAKVEKTKVKDPRKLTAENKKAIDAAIRKAYTVNGVSKLPDGNPGTDWEGIPAVIQIDDSGNVKIFSADNVEVTYDSNYNVIPVKNEDGSYKVKDGAQPKITIQAKDLVKNIKPDAPAVKEGENNKVTITPNKEDTDITKVTVKYKDKNNEDKTETVDVKKDANGKWNTPDGSKLSVNDDGQSFSFDVSDVINGGTVTAQFTDNGGLTQDEGPLDSDPTSITLTEKVDVTFDGNGGGGSMNKATVKKGDNYKLPESKFTAPEGKEFDGWVVNGENKKVGDDIKVDSNTTVTAKWKDSMVDVTFNGNGGGGSMNKATVKKGSTYKLPESKFTPPAGKVFAGWMIGDSKEVKAVGTEIKVDGPIKLTAVYKDAPNSSNGSGYWFVPAPAEPEKEIGRHDRYLYGYEDKRVRPEGNITRAEAAALIARLAELDMSDKSKPDFVDTPSAWYNSAINIMVKKDLMFGDKNGNFRPAEPITRGEFARALLYIDATNDKVAPFADVKGHQFEAAINQAYGNNRISGYPDGTFRPDAYIQRAEAARILNQYANRGTTLEGMAPVAKDLIQFTDINPSHWAYCEVMEAANTHEYERVKGTQAETWLRILHDEMKR